MTLLSVFLDRNSICCTGMNNEKPILASEVTQDAETAKETNFLELESASECRKKMFG